MSDTTEQLQRYIDAIKLDILDLFNKPTLNVFEFRRIGELCEIMIPLCNSAAGGTIMPSVINNAMWESEEKAPTLHSALGGHVFDVDTLLQEKYRAMAKTHEDLRLKLAHAALAERDHVRNATILAGQIENIGFMEAGLAAQRQLLDGRAAELDRRELQLTSGGSSEATKKLSSGATIDAEHEPDEQQGEAP